MIEPVLEVIRTKAAPILIDLVGAENTIGTFITANPVLSVLLLTAIPAIILLIIALFADFVADAWKIPFGIAADILAFYAYLNPGWLTIGATVASVAVIIIFLHDIEAMKWVFAALSAGEIAITAIPGVPSIFVTIAGLLCLNTILFFIGAIID